MPVDARQTLAHLRRLDEARARRAGERANRLRAKLPEAAAALARHGAQRTFLFGSLARGAPRPESDVDLAVEGLPAGRYFDALAELMALFGAPVDLVRLEEAAESLKARVLAEGRLL